MLHAHLTERAEGRPSHAEKHEHAAAVLSELALASFLHTVSSLRRYQGVCSRCSRPRHHGLEREAANPSGLQPGLPAPRCHRQGPREPAAMRRKCAGMRGASMACRVSSANVVDMRGRAHIVLSGLLFATVQCASCLDVNQCLYESLITCRAVETQGESARLPSRRRAVARHHCGCHQSDESTTSTLRSMGIDSASLPQTFGGSPRVLIMAWAWWFAGIVGV